VLIEFDASGWASPEDFYLALLPALGAPEWHGHNLDAIGDSIFAGGINRVAPPCHFAISGTDALSGEMRGFLRRLQVVFDSRRSEADATISFEPPL